MTLMSFGRAMPIHMDMLSLVGYESAERDLVPAKSLNARKRAMMKGLHALRKTTMEDFGYDVSLWREFLIESGNQFGYTHPYAYHAVDKAVQNALADPDVLEALASLEMEQKSRAKKR